MMSTIEGFFFSLSLLKSRSNRSYTTSDAVIKSVNHEIYSGDAEARDRSATTAYATSETFNRPVAMKRVSNLKDKTFNFKYSLKI